MGLLSRGTPLSWDKAETHSDYVRLNGIDQLIRLYNRVRDRSNNCLCWGDEVEYILVECDHPKRMAHVSTRAEQVLEALQGEMEEKMKGQQDACDSKKIGFTAIWHPEYARYMLESTPAKPYRHDIKNILCVQENMEARRRQAEALLASGEILLSIGNFPRLGCPDSIQTDADFISNEASRSLFFPDELINRHVRFKTLTMNIRQRRGSKISINVPLFQDSKTGTVPNAMLFPEDLEEGDELPPKDKIYLDAMGFGMGCCCLQVTFQACSIDEARLLYDQLAVLCPIVLALSAATPIYRGVLSDVDCRWDVISASVDDRTPEERGLEPLSSARAVIPKSRYDSISRYIANDDRLRPEYDDLQVPFDPQTLSSLLEAGFDERLAKHFAYLFIRDPLVIYTELLQQDNESSMDHFENIQSTNWQTMRFKPPPPASDIGWRVEFRPTEVQPTDFENAAFVVFIVLLTRMILTYRHNFYLPISKVDENMKRAQQRDAVLRGKFYFRKTPFPFKSAPLKVEDEYSQYTLNEIVNGVAGQVWEKNEWGQGNNRVRRGGESERDQDQTQEEFPGLIPLIKSYIKSLQIDNETHQQLLEYLRLIEYRARGELMTPAAWMRQFVSQHPEYKHDSIVTPSITYDMIQAFDKITHSHLGESSINKCCEYSRRK